MKILVISNYSGRSSSRPEAELMLGLFRKGISITIMTPKEADYVPDFIEAGIRVIDFQPRKKFDRNEIQFIRNELLSGDYDIVHLFNGKAIINGIRAARGLRTKVVLYRGYCGNIHWWDPTAYFKYLHPRVDAIWCIAPAVADLINRNILFGKKKARCITKGHRPEWYQQVTPAKAEGIPDHAFVAVMVANARPMKGLKFLIEATHQLDRSIPLYIMLIGKGLDSPAIRKRVNKSPIKDQILFTGYRSDALNLVKGADVFVLSSIYGEAICKSVIEAMSLGIPAVITDIPGNRGLVLHKESGMVVPRKSAKFLAQALQYMYDNCEERKQMAAAAQLRMARQYHIDTTIDEMESFYSSLVSK